MSNRRRSYGKARRKLFACGHKGFGQWCHWCEQHEQGRVPPVPVRFGNSKRAQATRAAQAEAARPMLPSKLPRNLVAALSVAIRAVDELALEATR
jgi:hypothetical protein